MNVNIGEVRRDLNHKYPSVPNYHGKKQFVDIFYTKTALKRAHSLQLKCTRPLGKMYFKVLNNTSYIYYSRTVFVS